MEGKIDQAATYYEEALAIFREHGVARGTANVLFNLAIVANERLDYPAGVPVRSRSGRRGEGPAQPLFRMLDAAARRCACGGERRCALCCAHVGRLRCCARSHRGSFCSVPIFEFHDARASSERGSRSATLRSRRRTQRGRALSLDEAIAEIDTWLERYLGATESLAATGASVKS